jgi:hypothetical protein
MKKSKWFSKKLFVALVGVLVVILNDILKLGIDTDSLWQLAGIVSSYLFGQSIVDHQKEKQKAQE